MISLMITDSMIPFVNEGIRVRDEDFGLIVISKRTPILTLNKDSTVIWKCIKGDCTIKQICEKINNDYGFDSESNYKIVVEFLENCHKLGLVDFK